MEEDDGVDVVAAALWDSVVAAKLLLCLSRPEAVDVPSSPLPPPLTPPTELTWRRKGSRSRTITREGIRAAEREDARRGSPTTPLSWSVDGSGTSGSVCSGGAASRRRKRARDGEDGEAKKGRRAAAGEKRIRVPLPPAKGTKHEPPLDREPAANPFGASSISASDDKVVAVVSSAPDDAMGKPAAADTVECPQPLRWMSPAVVEVGPVAIGRQGKKKTFAELQAMVESLLQEQAGLRKELESLMALHGALLEDNTMLKKVELTMALRREAMPAQAVQTQHVEHEPAEPVLPSPCTAPAALEQGGGGGSPCGELQSCTAQRRFFTFDLNCVPQDGGF